MVPPLGRLDGKDLPFAVPQGDADALNDLGRGFHAEVFGADADAPDVICAAARGLSFGFSEAKYFAIGGGNVKPAARRDHAVKHR